MATLGLLLKNKRTSGRRDLAVTEPVLVEPGAVKNGKAADTIPPDHQAGGRFFNAADKQFIDWQIPLDAEIEFIQETGTETAAFANQVLAYIRTKSPFSIKRDSIPLIVTDKDKTERFYIDFRGDHQYVISVFNKYRP